MAASVSPGLFQYLNSVFAPRTQISPGAPLGIEKNSKFGYMVKQLQTDEQLFFYTDGLTENSGPDGTVYSRRQLRAQLKNNLSPNRLKEQILKDCTEIWQNNQREDDFSFLVLRWLGSASGYVDNETQKSA